MLQHSPLLKNTCVIQVVLDKWLPLNIIMITLIIRTTTVLIIMQMIMAIIITMITTINVYVYIYIYIYIHTHIYTHMITTTITTTSVFP